MPLFEVGQMVMCIHDKWPAALCQLPVKGCVYTVRDVEPHHDCGGKCGLWFIRLNEISNPVQPGFAVEPSFIEYAFAPVRKTSIDVFTDALNKAPSDLETV